MEGIDIMENKCSKYESGLNEIKREYDAWLHWHLTFRCNLNCPFCINKIPLNIKRIKNIGMTNLPGVAIRKLRDKLKSKNNSENIKIDALMKILNKTNKTFNIGVVGGEPFLVPDIIDAFTEITKRHYVSLNTNLSTKNIKEFAEKISPHRVVHIDASCHYTELKRHNLIDMYIENFLFCQEKGFNISAQEVGYPPLLEEIDKYKKFFKEKGIELTFGHFFGKYKGKLYPESYTQKQLELFGLEDIERFYQKGKLCNAGYNVGVVSITGDIYPCTQIGKTIGNIYEKINFNDGIIMCPFNFCCFPLNFYDDYLYHRALKERKMSHKKRKI